MAATALLETLDVAAHADLERCDDDLYEIVDGQRTQGPTMSAYAAKVASRLIRKMGAFADDQELGEVVGEVLFRLPLTEDSGRNRKPDVAFVSSQRWPRDRPRRISENAWDVVPDLAVEVVSPHDLAENLLDRVFEYFPGWGASRLGDLPQTSFGSRLRGSGPASSDRRGRRPRRRRGPPRFSIAAGSLV